jgi:hypothetical protein
MDVFADEAVPGVRLKTAPSDVYNRTPEDLTENKEQIDNRPTLLNV